MPDLEPDQLCREMLNLLFDAGPAEAGFSGPQRLSWRELSAWCERTGELISAQEARLIRQLSGVYCAAVNEMSEHDAKSPLAEAQEAQAEKRESGLAAAFRSFKPKKS